MFSIIFSFEVFGIIKSLVKSSNIEIIILYNTTYNLSKKIFHLAKKNNITIISDVTEIYELNISIHIDNFIRRYFANKRFRFLDKKINNIISISPYLYNYFYNEGCNVILIPPIFELKSNRDLFNITKEFKIVNIVYIGSPGNKDILLPLIEAIINVNNLKIEVRLDLVGLDISYFKNKYTESILKDKSIFLHGILEHKKALEILKNADFSVLFRYDRVYAKAGFSTKFAESMCYGVPVICNRVGGADLIIENMVDGFIIETCKQEDIITILKIIISLERSSIEALKQSSYKKACQVFNIYNYISELEQFIDNTRLS